MSNTLIAMFDTETQATNAMQALVEQGIQQDYVKKNPAQLQSGGAGMDGYFTTLFGGDTQTADAYGKAVRDGKTVMTVEVDDATETDRATGILHRFSPLDIEQLYGNAGRNDASTGSRPAGETVLPVIEEELTVGKREVQRGGVRVVQRIVSTPVDEQVALREEHVTIERVPVDRPISANELDAIQDQSLEITEMAEEAVVAKQARIVEEVVVGKEVEQRSEVIHDTVRKTEVEVEKLDGSPKKPSPRRSR